MFEAWLVSLYLQKHPEKVDDYIDYDWIQLKRYYDYLKSTPHHSADVSRDDVARALKKYREVRARFKEPRSKKERPRWTTASIRQMAESAGRVDLSGSFYLWASSLHHVDFGAIVSHTDRETMAVSQAPATDAIAVAAIVGHGAVIQTLSAFNKVAKAGLDEQVQTAFDDFAAAWKE